MTRTRSKSSVSKATRESNGRKQRKLKSGAYYVRGAKWWDKVNGNTYNAAKITDSNGDEVARLAFAYGYGDHYRHRASEYIKEHARKNARIKIIDSGADYTLKRDLKNFNF